MTWSDNNDSNITHLPLLKKNKRRICVECGNHLAHTLWWCVVFHALIRRIYIAYATMMITFRLSFHFWIVSFSKTKREPQFWRVVCYTYKNASNALIYFTLESNVSSVSDEPIYCSGLCAWSDQWKFSQLI